MTTRDSILRSSLLTLTSYGFYLLVLELAHLVVMESSIRGPRRITLVICAAAGFLGCLIGCRMYRALRLMAACVVASSALCLTGMYSQGHRLLAIVVPLCLALNAAKGMFFVSSLDSPEPDSARRHQSEYALAIVYCAEIAVVGAGVLLSPVR